MKLSVVFSLQPAQFQAATFKGDLGSSLKTIASLGYQGVELAIRDPKLVDQNQLNLHLQRCGLSVPAIGTGQAWGEEGLSFTDPDGSVRKQAIARILSHFDLAARFNAVIILGLIRGIGRSSVKASDALEWLHEAVWQLDQAASKYGVRLAIEPINRQETTLVNKAEDGLTLIKKLALKNVGLLLDTYHMNLEEKNIHDAIRASGSHIFHFHVADSNRMHPGAGKLDFRSILSTLGATGYQGWISGEFLPQPNAESAARENIVHLRMLEE